MLWVRIPERSVDLRFSFGDLKRNPEKSKSWFGDKKKCSLVCEKVDIFLNYKSIYVIIFMFSTEAAMALKWMSLIEIWGSFGVFKSHNIKAVLFQISSNSISKVIPTHLISDCEVKWFNFICWQ